MPTEQEADGVQQNSAVHESSEVAQKAASDMPAPSQNPSRSQEDPATSGIARELYTPPSWSAPPQHKFCFEQLKNGTIVDTFALDTKPHYLIGRNADLCDIVYDHSSVSRVHLIVQFRDDGRAFVFDQSTHGCRVNKQKLAKKQYTELRVGDVIEVGHSSRLLILNGPDELRPPERGTAAAELAIKVKASREGESGLTEKEKRLKELARRRELAVELYRRQQAEKAKLEEEAAKLEEAEGATWGFGSDASDDDEPVCDGLEVLSMAHRLKKEGRLKEKHFDAVAKMDRKKHKIDNLRQEIKRIRSKEKGGRDLSGGQVAQIDRCEKQIQQLADNLDEAASQLHSTVLRHLLADDANIEGIEGQDDVDMLLQQRQAERLGIGSKSNKNKEIRRQADSDEEDDFYNRASSKRAVSKLGKSFTAQSTASGSDVISYESVQMQLETVGQRETEIQLELRRLEAHESELSTRDESEDVEGYLHELRLNELKGKRRALQVELNGIPAQKKKLHSLLDKLRTALPDLQPKAKPEEREQPTPKAETAAKVNTTAAVPSQVKKQTLGPAKRPSNKAANSISALLSKGIGKQMKEQNLKAEKEYVQRIAREETERKAQQKMEELKQAKLTEEQQEEEADRKFQEALQHGTPFLSKEAEEQRADKSTTSNGVIVEEDVLGSATGWINETKGGLQMAPKRAAASEGLQDRAVKRSKLDDEDNVSHLNLKAAILRREDD